MVAFQSTAVEISLLGSFLKFAKGLMHQETKVILYEFSEFSGLIDQGL